MEDLRFSRRSLWRMPAVFWDIKTQIVPHTRHITSPLQSPASQYYVRFEVFTAVTMKNVVFWDIMPCGSCKNGRFRGMYRLHYQDDKNRRARNNVSSNQQLKHAVSPWWWRRYVPPKSHTAYHPKRRHSSLENKVRVQKQRPYEAQSCLISIARLKTSESLQRLRDARYSWLGVEVISPKTCRLCVMTRLAFRRNRAWNLQFTGCLATI
jgi:hypothetical protein